MNILKLYISYTLQRSRACSAQFRPLKREHCRWQPMMAHGMYLSAKKSRRWGHSSWPGGGPFQDMRPAQAEWFAAHVSASMHSTCAIPTPSVHAQRPHLSPLEVGEMESARLQEFIGLCRRGEARLFRRPTFATTDSSHVGGEIVLSPFQAPGPDLSLAAGRHARCARTRRDAGSTAQVLRA